MPFRRFLLPAVLLQFCWYLICLFPAYGYDEGTCDNWICATCACLLKGLFFTGILLDRLLPVDVPGILTIGLGSVLTNSLVIYAFLCGYWRFRG